MCANRSINNKSLSLTHQSNMNIIEGKLNLVVSTLNSGKTTLLSNLAAAYTKDGKHSLYYALDSSEQYIQKRVHSLLNNVALADIRPNISNKYIGLKIPSNILLANQPLDPMALEFDIELCANIDVIFIDTLNIFNNGSGSFDDKLKRNVVYLNSLCKKHNITIIASLNVLQVQTFKIEDWKDIVGGNILYVNNQYINFKIFDSKADIHLEYEIVNSHMLLTKETSSVSTQKKHNIKHLYIKSSGFEPEVNFNFEQKHFTIKGRSYPTTPTIFWGPVVEWIEAAAKKTDCMCLDIDLDYINSSSEKYILETIKALPRGNSTVIWRYEVDDEDVRDMGHNLEKLTEAKFSFISRLDVNNTMYSDSDIYD